MELGLLADRYQVVRPIGTGAMTRVLEAWDRRENHRVALKVLIEPFAGDEVVLERLERQAQAAASLSHPNIAAVYATGRNGQVGFVAVELIDGSSLRDMLAVRGPLPPAGAARVAAQVGAALAAAHQRGVTHGHLTPANILLAINGQVKVTDFGLAQATQPLAGTPDPAVDLRALGRCLAFMLTGREPAQGEPVRLGPVVPAELAAIVAKAAGEPEAYRSAGDLGRDLNRFLATTRPIAARAGYAGHAPAHDEPDMLVTAASAPGAQLMRVSAAGRPSRAAAGRAPSTARRRGLTLIAGLVGVGLVVVVVTVVGLLDREPTRPPASHALTPSVTVATTATRQPATSRAPAATAPPATSLPATAALPTTTRQTTTTEPVVGPGERIVPDVVGLHRQQAADALNQAQLEIEISLVPVRDPRQVQRVLAQQPPAGQVVPAGSEVTVLVGTRRPSG
jgi:eukaryotic-like serine/threonine-protein kinase